MSDECWMVRGREYLEKSVTTWLETAQQSQYDWMREHLGIRPTQETKPKG